MASAAGGSTDTEVLGDLWCGSSGSGMMDENAKLILSGNNTSGCSLTVGGVDLFKALMVTGVQVTAMPGSLTTVTLQVLLPEICAYDAEIILPHETLAELARMNGFSLVPIKE